VGGVWYRNEAGAIVVMVLAAVVGAAVIWYGRRERL
jgi:hypothetical protein